MDPNFFIDPIATIRAQLNGPLLLPIIIAVLCLIAYFARGPALRLAFRTFGVSDPAMAQTIKRKVDAPLQLLLLALLLLPFAMLLKSSVGAFVVIAIHLCALFLLLHTVIQSIDLIVFSWYLEKRGTAVSSVMRFFALLMMYGIATLLLLDWGMGVSVLPLLATSTVMTAVVGLALQDTLKNIFAGLNMSFEQSFREGDWISFRFDSKEMFGQIVEIGWRTTKVKTLNQNHAIIPNSQFTSHELINYTRPTQVFARSIEIAVNPKSVPDAVRNALIQAATGTDGVLANPAPEALPIEIKPGHVVYQLRFWLATAEQRESLTGAVLHRVWLDLQEMNALPS